MFGPCRRKRMALASMLWLLVIMLQLPAAAQADDAERLARAYHSEATKQFEIGKLKEAAQLYSKAYQTHPLPKYLYNLGLCHLKLGTLEDLQRAEINFLGCTRKAPEGRIKEAARQQLQIVSKRIVELRKQAAHKPSPARPGPDPVVKPTAVVGPRPAVPLITHTPDPPPPVSSTPVYKKWWFWTIIGVAVVGGTLGGVFGAQASQDSRVPEGASLNYDSMKLGGGF